MDGKVLLDTEVDNIGNSEGNEKYFVETVSTQLPQASRGFYRTDGTRIIRFSSPIRNSNFTIVGVLRVEYTATILQKILIESTVSAGENTKAILLDEYNIQLVNSADEGQTQKTIAPIPEDQYNTAIREKRLIDYSQRQAVILHFIIS